MADSLGVSGTNNPYITQTYSASSNEKNTLTIESYFKLLAAQPVSYTHLDVYKRQV